MSTNAEIYKLKIEIAALYGIIESMLEDIPSLKKREEYFERLVAGTNNGLLMGFDFTEELTELNTKNN